MRTMSQNKSAVCEPNSQSDCKQSESLSQQFSCSSSTLHAGANETCDTCEETFEKNIDNIVSEATPPTESEHSSREEEVNSAYNETK